MFGEILDWMLAPLLLLWPISIAVTNLVSHSIADQPYDDNLGEALVQLVRHVKAAGPEQITRFPRALQEHLTGDGQDSRHYRVTANYPGAAVYVPERGSSPKAMRLHDSPVDMATAESDRAIPPELGEVDLPVIAQPVNLRPGETLFRDATLRGVAVRVAYSFTYWDQPPVPLLVQVAETRNKRDALSTRIISGVLLPHFAIIPLAVVLVYLGLGRGLAPLRRLQARMRGRRPGDLTQLEAARVPEEVRPLVDSFNDILGRLETNLSAQQRFIADAAHQMRTPLTGLKTQTELALAEEDPARVRRALRLIAESANRAAHLTNQLLTLARTEASYEKLHRVEPVDLRMLARAATLEWADRALAKGIDLAFDADTIPHMTEGVPLLLREMLSNLLDNAIKYTPRDGRVTVRLRLSEFVVLEVDDNGPGIAPEERDKVFERFYRVLGTDESGSGLGLPIVAEIVELHRGRISLTASDSGGCLFCVSLLRRGGQIAPVDLRPD